jgi:hypothetical protein
MIEFSLGFIIGVILMCVVHASKDDKWKEKG